jgi:hypothetical protein
MTSITRHIRLLTFAVAMTGTIAVSWGCAKKTPSSRPAGAAAAAAPETPSAASPPTASPSTASPSTSAPDAPSSTPWLTVDDQVREAVFRHLFTHNASGMKDSAPVYFLSVGEADKPRDPSPELMARFAGHKPRVEPVSHARVSFDEGVRHRDTGEQGIIFRITSLKRVSENVVEAEGGYYVGNLSASGNVFRVERIAGVWVVTGDKMEWIA